MGLSSSWAQAKDRLVKAINDNVPGTGPKSVEKNDEEVDDLESCLKEAQDYLDSSANGSASGEPVSIESELKRLYDSWKRLPSIEPKDDEEEENRATTLRDLPLKRESGVVRLDTSLLANPESVDQAKHFRKVVDPVVVAKQAREERTKSTGSKWFDMPAGEMTPETKRDLQLLKMRHVLDPKRHYRKADWKDLPKYFQKGTVVEGPTEFFSSRLTKAERKRTLTDELLSNDDTKAYFKRRYSEIQTKKTSGKKAHYKQVMAKRRKF